MHHHRHFRCSFVPKHHKCPHSQLGAIMFLIHSFIGSLVNRGGGAFCSACGSVTWVYCVCLNHVITLSHCSLTAKHNTVPTHETHYFAIKVNFKKCLTGVSNTKKSRFYLKHKFLHFSPNSMYFLSTNKQTSGQHLFVCWLTRARMEAGSVFLPFTFPVAAYKRFLDCAEQTNIEVTFLKLNSFFDYKGFI